MEEWCCWVVSYNEGLTRVCGGGGADLAAMEAEVRAIKKEGLLWGSSRLMPVGFGIKKLQITAVIEDAKARPSAFILLAPCLQLKSRSTMAAAEAEGSVGCPHPLSEQLPLRGGRGLHQ